MKNTVDILFDHYLESPDNTELQEKCESLLVDLVNYSEVGEVTEPDLTEFYYYSQKAAFYAAFKMAINCFVGPETPRLIVKEAE